MRFRRDRPTKRWRARSTSSSCRRTSPSSWTATAGGRRSGICRASKDTAPASIRSATSVETSARARDRRAHAVRVLRRELEAAARRSQHADDAAEALHPARAQHAAQEQHPVPRDRPRRGARARRAARARARHPADRGEHRHAVQHRAELRRPRGDRRRGAPRDRGRHRTRRSRRAALRATSSTRPASPIRIC